MTGNKKQKLAILMALSDWTDQSENSSVPLPTYDEFINLHDETLVNELIDLDDMVGVIPGMEGVLKLKWKAIELIFDVMVILNKS